MDETARNEAIDAYFQALDTGELERVRPYLADSFVYESLAGDLHGFEGLREYMEEHRSFSGTTHETTTRVHGEAMTMAEGVVSGGGGESDFCDVFEFDGDGNVTRIAVYLNDA
jgi:ketosteroid isomerase-like protein